MDKITTLCNLCNLKWYKNRVKSAFKRFKWGYCTNCTNCAVPVNKYTHMCILILNNIINIYILLCNIAICAIWRFLIQLRHFLGVFILHILHTWL